MIDELSKTIKAQLYERVGSPLFSSFAISWACWNYKFILVIISSMGAVEKLNYINTHLFNTPLDYLLNGTLLPTVTALLIIYVYPIPARHVYEYHRKKQQELKKLQHKIDGETVITKEEKWEIIESAERQKNDYESRIEKLIQDNNLLKNRLAHIEQNTPPTSRTEIQKDETTPPFTNDELKILNIIANSTDDGTSITNIIQMTQIGRMYVEHYVRKLEDLNLITRSLDKSHIPKYRLSEKGIEILIAAREGRLNKDHSSDHQVKSVSAIKPVGF
ncbi:hypothetical protein [Azovibrio restrictus]|uniref:hypothetical protein n=1 Tax=Azovibrio restrictus TaxID=146938 RepID=UPI0012EB0EC6|nr:hypothetical protein [Azovibrio restrictus]